VPFTPFHFGPSGCVALPLHRYLDLPVVLLANVAVDVEPLFVLIFQPNYPLHGLAHSFLGAAVVGGVFGALASCLQKPLSYLMTEVFRLSYQPSRGKYILSGVCGAWLHVLLDMLLYHDMQPFFPLSSYNPLLGLMGYDQVYFFSGMAVVPAVGLYLFLRNRAPGQKK
jgi:membrane-bound metal-dependent hydrolase YbcI (DUF457 family)